MPKKIFSPIPRYKGSVTLADPLSLSQAQLIEQGMKPPEVGDDGRAFLSLFDEKELPAVIACVEQWELEGIPPDVTIATFPGSPRGDSHKLIDWIFRELFQIYSGEQIVPNASGPTHIDTPAKADEAKNTSN